MLNRIAVNERTPLVETKEGIFLKLEYLQLGGSHKARAAKNIVDVLASTSTTLLQKQTVLLESTGGNFGIGLAVHSARHGFEVALVVDPKFSCTKQNQLKKLGVSIVGQELFEAGWEVSEVLEKCKQELISKGKEVILAGQFTNDICVSAHEEAARHELVPQLHVCGIERNTPITFICGCGSGAHLSGYSKALRNFFADCKIVLSEPQGCCLPDSRFAPHDFTGLSIGRRPEFYGETMHESHLEITLREVKSAEKQLIKGSGLFLGPSSCLVYAAALKAKSRAPDRKVIMLAYDAGDSYLSDESQIY